MKQCPACQSTFDDKVDFCFSDGTPLVAIDASADPTALPGTMDTASSESDEVTEVRPKRSRRGMFGRPSVADMLSMSDSGATPPVGGHRVPSESAPEPEVTPEVQATTIVEAVVDIPDTEDSDTEEVEVTSALSPPTPSIEVPVLPAVVELPDTDEQGQEPTEAPPGFEPETTALDDSWFGGDSEAEFSEDTQPLPTEPIEDPGFADVAEASSGGDDIGFDDSPWSAAGASTASQPIPKNFILAGVAVLAACVLLTVVLSGGDEPVPQAEVATAPAAPTPATPPPPPVEVIEEEPEVEPAEVEEDAPDPVEEPAEDEPPAAVPVPVVAPAPPVEPKKTPPPAEPKKTPPAAATARTAPASTAKAAPIPSPWTGAPAVVPAPAPAASANPWGAPADSASRGHLTITTEPADAMVYVDERRIGKSPTRTEVDYGTHKIRVELSDFKSMSRVVNVRASEVSVPFRMESARLVGRCNLLGSPGSEVVMDGRSIGAIPITVDCEPGSHSFTVSPPGGASFTASRSVTFARSGETANIFLTP